ELGDAQRAEALLPPVERLLADAELAADLADRRAGLGLAQREGDLLVGELARLHSHGPPARAARVSGDRSLAQNEALGGLRCGEERLPMKSSGFSMFGLLSLTARGQETCVDGFDL